MVVSNFLPSSFHTIGYHVVPSQISTIAFFTIFSGTYVRNHVAFSKLFAFSFNCSFFRLEMSQSMWRCPFPVKIMLITDWEVFWSNRLATAGKEIRVPFLIVSGIAKHWFQTVLRCVVHWQYLQKNGYFMIQIWATESEANAIAMLNDDPTRWNVEYEKH